jgi:hypothetical protein
VTALVEMAKLALPAPAGMVTVFPFGKNAARLLLVNDTSAPPAGAGPPSETSFAEVPCANYVTLTLQLEVDFTLYIEWDRNQVA